MPNLLPIPFKKTYSADIKDAVREYISAYSGAHPDEFKEDIKVWQDLRKDGVGVVVHSSRIDSILLYHAQLISIMAKFPSDIHLFISYAPVFGNKSGLPISLPSLAFEKASVLFNLAALYSQLAANEDRSTLDGIKRAVANYQNAAGTLLFLHSSALPRLTHPPDTEDIPLDLSEPFVKGLEFLMLAQAQECSWQLAKINNYKNSLIAKIAARAATLYQTSVTTFREASHLIKQMLPSDWLPHIEAKAHHFSAVAELRKSMEEIDASRYGLELARLSQAQSEAKQAYDIALRGGVTQAVINDIKSLLETVQKSIVRAERDNDLIYHQDVPAISVLPPIQQTNLVNSTTPVGLTNPSSVVGSRPFLFERLLNWGAREAINLYNYRKDTLVKEQVIDVSQALQDHVDSVLRKLHLPSSLEALERPIGLPPSLLRKAEEIRMEDGPAKIEASIEDVQRLAQQDLATLDEAMDILDNEASEDESARKESPLDRPPSHEANKELIEKEKRYRSILSQAAASDEVVRQKWDEWEQSITELSMDEADLEASVPSSTVSSTAQNKQTRNHARALRVKLEELDSLRREREQLVNRAKMLAEADDIEPLIRKGASGFERLTEVQPAMFEDLSEEQLAKYDKFLHEFADMEQKERALLVEIESLNEVFLQSRKDDPSVKAREHALQSLDLAYLKYKEITRNLDEGFQFYNGLAEIFRQFKEVCRSWSHQRIQEIHSISKSMQSVTLNDQEESSDVHTPNSKSTSAAAIRKLPVGKSSLGLPSINSSDWGFKEIQLPPGPGEKKD